MGVNVIFVQVNYVISSTFLENIFLKKIVITWFFFFCNHFEELQTVLFKVELIKLSDISPYI